MGRKSVDGITDDQFEERQSATLPQDKENM